MVSTTLQASASVKNNGTVTASNIALGFSVQNQTSGTWYDLPWEQISNLVVDAQAGYSLTANYDLPVGAYNGRFAVWTGATGGTPVSGSSGYFSGGTSERTDCFS